MAIKSVKSNYLLLMASILFLALSGVINTSIVPPKLTISKQQSALNINSDFLKIFSLGQNRLISSFLWISTLIESDIDHYRSHDLNSWMYLRFKSILTLDPKFLRAYQFGGKYLNIVKDDLLGSKEIFSLGLKQYPNDYDLLINFGFLLAFELQEFEAASLIYERLLNFQKLPLFYKTLALKVKYQGHKNLNIIFSVLSDMYLKEPDGSYLKKKIASDLYAIKAEIDLTCLNVKKLKTCSRVDFQGRPYIKTNTLYMAQRKYVPYRLHLREKKGEP